MYTLHNSKRDIELSSIIDVTAKSRQEGEISRCSLEHWQGKKNRICGFKRGQGGVEAYMESMSYRKIAVAFPRHVGASGGSFHIVTCLPMLQSQSNDCLPWNVMFAVFMGLD